MQSIRCATAQDALHREFFDFQYVRWEYGNGGKGVNRMCPADRKNRWHLMPGIQEVRTAAAWIGGNGFRGTISRIGKLAAGRFLPPKLNELGRVFWKTVMPGYRYYAELLNQYGAETKILFCAFFGTGDYYLTGQYLRACLERNHIREWIFLSAEHIHVTELFAVYKGHLQYSTLKELEWLRTFHCFAFGQTSNIINLHHQIPHPKNWMWNVTNSSLIGWRGLNMVDFYLRMGFALPGNTPTEQAVFETDREKVTAVFRENHLQEGKTVLLSPYSTGLKAYAPGMELWEEIAEIFRGGGAGAYVPTASEGKCRLQGHVPCTYLIRCWYRFWTGRECLLVSAAACAIS